MPLAKDYRSVMARSEEIMKKALGLDYSQFESGSIAFDYEKLMDAAGYHLQEVIAIQRETGIGSTPLMELRIILLIGRKFILPILYCLTFNIMGHGAIC